MPDVFLVSDDRMLLAKWDHLAAVFRIVARDYRRVLDGSVPADRHRTILVQTVSDLLELEADLARLARPSPADGFDGWVLGAWQSAAAWVRELRAWRIPSDRLSVGEVEAALERRQRLEVEFNAALGDAESEAEGTAGLPVVVVSLAG